MTAVFEQLLPVGLFFIAATGIYLFAAYLSWRNK